jgi:hypothetical protein
MYTELGLNNTDAISQANKYNHRRLNANLLVGITDAAKNKILNWDLI